MVARQVRRSVVMSNLQIRLLPMDSDRTPLGKGKDVLHGAARAAPLIQSVEQPCWIDDTALHFFSEGSLGGSSIVDDRNSLNLLVVKAERLRNVLADKHVDFLKLDIEGAENEVL